ncbi:DNA-binding protein SMUBP-2 [Orbilia oligospora]|nr:DNA-binding protein SMUBP-2 [Orbilia oligospora]
MADQLIRKSRASSPDRGSSSQAVERPRKRLRKRTNIIFNQRYDPITMVLKWQNDEKSTELLHEGQRTNTRLKVFHQPNGLKTMCFFCPMPARNKPSNIADLQFIQFHDGSVDIRALMFSKDGKLWSPGENEKPNPDDHYMVISIRFDIPYSNQLPPKNDRTIHHSIDWGIFDSIAGVKGGLLEMRFKPWLDLYNWILKIQEPVDITYQQRVLDRWWRDRREFETTWHPIVKREYELMKAETEKYTITGLLAEFEEFQVFSNSGLEPAADLPEEDIPKRGSKLFRVTLRPGPNFELPLDNNNQPLRIECKEGSKFRLLWPVPGEKNTFFELEGTVSAEDEYRSERSPGIVASMVIPINQQTDPRKGTVFSLQMVADTTIYDRQVRAINNLAKPRPELEDRLKPEEVFLLGKPASPILLSTEVDFHAIWQKSLFSGGLDESQTLAAMKCLEYNASVIQGPPGTGKSFTVIQTVIAFLRAQIALAIESIQLEIRSWDKEQREREINDAIGSPDLETAPVKSNQEYIRPRPSLEDWHKRVPHVLVTAGSNYAVNQLLRIWHSLVNQPDYSDLLDKVDPLVVRYVAENLYHFQPGDKPGSTKAASTTEPKHTHDDDVDYDDDNNDEFERQHDIEYKRRHETDSHGFDDRWSAPLLLEVRDPRKTQFPSQYSHLVKQQTLFPGRYERLINLKRKVASGRANVDDVEEIRGVTMEMNKMLFLHSLVLFSTTSSSGAFTVSTHFKPNVVVIDEASQLSELDTCVSYASSTSIRQIILAGDHIQLPPINTHSIPFLQMSGLEKIANIKEANGGVLTTGRDAIGPGPQWTLLRHNYRSVRGLVQPVSQMFYDGLLRHTIENKREEDIFTSIWTQGCMKKFKDYPSEAPCILWHNVPQDSAMDDPASMSKLNYISADLIVQLLSIIGSEGNPLKINPRDIVVIPMYSAQVGVIKEAMKENLEGDMRNVKVTTLDSFQGQECPYVIIDLVRSTMNGTRVLGFLRDRRRINVALSRAKLKTIIFGDITMYSQSEEFQFGYKSKCLFELAQEILRKKNQSLRQY